MNKIAILMLSIGAVFIMSSTAKASLTKEQSQDVADFATTFIEKGNERRDEKGYPLLVYALSNNWNTCVEIRSKGYNEQLYNVSNNKYHGYRNLGNKWCMDCGAYIAYVYKTTLGFDLADSKTGDPWHITDFRDDANKGANSRYFEYVYKNVAIANIDESKLMPGDVVLRFGGKDNHGLIYIGKGWKQAHASYNAIRYDKKPPITGFQVVNGFYKTSTIVSIVRVKDGVVPEDKVINSFITWPDTGEYVPILNRLNIDYYEENEIDVDEVANTGVEPVTMTESCELHDDYEGISYVQNISNNAIVEDSVYDFVTARIKKMLEKVANNDEN